MKIIFLQPQFNQQIAASIAQAIGGAVMPMDDLAYDVVANLDDVAEKIAASNREKIGTLCAGKRHTDVPISKRNDP